ncbi:MAG: tRNA epoxyqueuosine(34) reductase QueG [Candidatus Marinimicrobia bacterium]|nr:tRNA epoxyqueuosine(34) reductase QueG [Candidatus Neomarinimicrobiota bacterium]
MISNQIVNNCVEKSGLRNWGATRPVLPEKWEVRFREWLREKYFAGMDWIQRNPEQRTNIRQRFPWCESVIVVADNYYSTPIRRPDIPYVSVYAYGDNYHKVVASKLEQVFECLKKQYSNLVHKIYVDTGPVLERGYAVEAGLGWLGKNNMLIVKGMGSYCFLGILLLNKKMEKYGSPIAGKCGDCTLCIDNCPTGALESAYTHNSNKCLSYLTIEKKGGFNKNEAQLIGDALYGCDACLAICPYNKKWVKKTHDERFYSKKEFLRKSYQEWANVTREEFKKAFQNSVFKRLGYDRLMRNLETLDEAIKK